MKKGALIAMMPGMGSTPNVVAFQFNPETLRHSWTQPQAGKTGSHPLAAQGLPGESFSFSLAMDVTDQLTLGENDPQRVLATASGIYSRLAALELLTFPADSNSGLLGASSVGSTRTVPASQLQTVLFVWGALRIVPVRVSSLTITEKLFDAELNPTHAEAQIELRVITSDELRTMTDRLSAFAAGAYDFSQSQRELLAIANLVNAAESIPLPPIPGI